MKSKRIFFRKEYAQGLDYGRKAVRNLLPKATMNELKVRMNRQEKIAEDNKHQPETFAYYKGRAAAIRSFLKRYEN